MSRQELAEAVNAHLWERHQIVERLDRADIGKLERGEHRWPGAHRREAFRAVLGASTDAELGFYINRRPRGGDNTAAAVRFTADQPGIGNPGTAADPAGMSIAAGLPPDRHAAHGLLLQIRRVLDARDLPEDGPVRSIDELRDAVAGVVRLRLQSDYQGLAAVLSPLLSELHRAYLGCVGQRRAAAAGLLAQCYRAADAVADKAGFYDLSARIIELMREAARESGDELALAAASYVRAETFFASGQLDTGRLMLERAAERLLPGSGIGATASYGALHMRAAVLSARAGRVAVARDHLAEARDCARRVPEGVFNGTVFGPASVRIHQVAQAVDAGDPDAALSAVARWTPPADLPAERRSHFYIEVARAGWQVGTVEQALDALHTAKTIAPQHVRTHPQVHQVLTAVAATGRRHDYRLQEFLAWTRHTEN